MEHSVEQLVTVREAPTVLPFILLSPGDYPARVGSNYQLVYREANHYGVRQALFSMSRASVVAVDFETRGADYTRDIEIVGTGLAWNNGSIYIHGAPTPDLLTELSKHRHLIAHNAYFDWGVLRSIYPEYNIRIHACTLALYALLANESPERKWGLKAAQVQVLGWEESNDVELSRWLISNGYSKGTGLNTRPLKGEMWRAPYDILGKYCVLDAESTYLLYTKILQPTLSRFPELSDYFYVEWMHHISIHIDQRLNGIPVDIDGLRKRREYLLERIADYSRQFLEHPSISNHIVAMESLMEDTLWNSEPEKFLKEKVPIEPKKFNIDGKISKSWTNWQERMRLMEEQGPTLSKNWIRWDEKRSLMQAGELVDYRFNINSGPQMCELLYGRLGFEVRVYTEKGSPGIGVKAYRAMGEIGQLLVERMWSYKELSYIEKYIELAEISGGRIHPSFRIPGTVTGRLSSRDPNMQQIPKSKAVMDLFQAPEGKVWIDLDFAAVEPTVATEFSQDPNMMRIYGDSAPANDIYLYVGAHVPGQIGDRIRATGYDPLNPTKETLARAKKECKKERSICKTVVLACQYGAGVNKIMQTLELDEIFLDYEQVREIHEGYWNLFSGVRDFGRELQSQWRGNRGYIRNGIGRPMCIPEDYKKDALNRFIQSTGHDLLVKYAYILTNELDRQGINWHPLVIDFHDASAVEVFEQDLQKTLEIYEWSLLELNRQLGGTIRLKGTPSFGRTLADIKEPEN